MPATDNEIARHNRPGDSGNRPPPLPTASEAELARILPHPRKQHQALRGCAIRYFFRSPTRRQWRPTRPSPLETIDCQRPRAQPDRSDRPFSALRPAESLSVPLDAGLLPCDSVLARSAGFTARFFRATVATPLAGRLCVQRRRVMALCAPSRAEGRL